MPERSRCGSPARLGRWLRPAVLLGVLLLGVALAGAAVLPGSAPPARAAEPIRGTGTLRFEAGAEGILTVDGTRRYRDTLELAAGGGPLISELDIEDYVAGVDEMPSRWPAEALRAQAIAARTYAWYVARTGVYDGFDICATVACQVYRGVQVELDEGRPTPWRAAVDDTAGQVLLDEGVPILARYFSTSGGRTYANEEAFPSEGPRDYLVSIEDPADAVSPYHRWTASFTRAQFDDVLSRGDTLSAAVPVAELERLGAVDDPNALIRVTGVDGTSVEVGARAFADFVSRIAPTRFPERFPQARADGLRPLPSTVPSSRFAPEVGADEVVLHGQGWGHGVGMGQYGARGRADAGQDHREILAAYYAGLTPTTSPELPERLRVGLTTELPVTIAGDVAFTIRSGEQIVAERALGSWHLDVDGDGWVLTPPDGLDAPLEPASTVELAALATAEQVVVETEVARPVLLYLEVVDAEGEVVTDRLVGAVDPGRHAASWDLTDDAGQLVTPGTYQVALVAEDGNGQRAGTPVGIEVGTGRSGTAGGPGADGLWDTLPGPWSQPGLAVVLIVGALGLLLAGIGGLLRASRAGRRDP